MRLVNGLPAADPVNRLREQENARSAVRHTTSRCKQAYYDTEFLIELIIKASDEQQSCVWLDPYSTGRQKR